MAFLKSISLETDFLLPATVLSLSLSLARFLFSLKTSFLVGDACHQSVENPG